jgi:endonuclease/exonuclease/phosphatase (EEP) superfamily protein YafD
MPIHGVKLNRWSSLLLLPLALLLFTAGSDVGARQGDGCTVSLGQGPIAMGEPLHGELDILSWNIQKASNEGWAEDLAQVAGDVHLAFIQEASLQARIPEAIPTPLVPAFASGYTTASQETGVMTLSKSNPSVHCNLTAWEPLLGTPKATSVTEYPLQDREESLLAINLHAVNFTLGMENFQAQFHALADLLKKHQGPIILAGDLNTWSEKRQALVDNFMSDHGLGAVIFEPDLRTTAFGRALDHIYIRGLQATFTQVIPVSSSDHNPLRVRLALQ